MAEFRIGIHRQQKRTPFRIASRRFAASQKRPIRMKYLLDTCVISDFVKGDHNTLTTLKSISPSDIAISAITVMEIQYGLALNPSRAKKIKSVISAVLASVTILD